MGDQRRDRGRHARRTGRPRATTACRASGSACWWRCRSPRSRSASGITSSRAAPMGSEGRRIDPLAEAFAGSADSYDRARPGYEDEPLDWAFQELGLDGRSVVLDLAAGTGKLSQALAPRAGQSDRGRTTARDATAAGGAGARGDAAGRHGRADPDGRRVGRRRLRGRGVPLVRRRPHAARDPPGAAAGRRPGAALAPRQLARPGRLGG